MPIVSQKRSICHHGPAQRAWCISTTWIPICIGSFAARDGSQSSEEPMQPKPCLAGGAANTRSGRLDRYLWQRSRPSFSESDWVQQSCPYWWTPSTAWLHLALSAYRSRCTFCWGKPCQLNHKIWWFMLAAFDVEVIALDLIELANIYLGEARLFVIYGRVNGHRVTLLAGPGVCERIALGWVVRLYVLHKLFNLRNTSRMNGLFNSKIKFLFEICPSLN